MTTRKLKVRRPPIVINASVKLVDGRVQASARMYFFHCGTNGKYSPFMINTRVLVETPYGFMGREKNLKGSKQEKYALQILYADLTKRGFRWNPQ